MVDVHARHEVGGALRIRVAPQHAAVGGIHECGTVQGQQLADVLQLGLGGVGVVIEGETG